MTVSEQQHTAFDAGLAALQQSFRDSLEGRILNLEAATALLRRDKLHKQALVLIRRDCHKIAGIAESLGFGQIGRFAASIDLMFAKDRASWPDIEAPVEKLLDAMEAGLEQA